MAKIVIVQGVIPLYTASLFERLAELPGIDLTVLADLETPSQLNQYDPKVHRFTAVHLVERRRGQFVFRPGLIRMLRRMQPDVVIFNGSPREISQLFAAIWCRTAGIPVGIWSMFHRVGKPRLWTEMYSRIIGAVGDVLMSYGERGRREQVARGTAENKIVSLGTAIDQTAVVKRRDEITQEEALAFRRQKGIEGKKILLHVVRLTEIKRPDLMVLGFQELTRLRSDTVLVWIGGGPLEEQTKARASAVGLTESMRFIGPLYDERELGLWYRSADVFVIATCIGLSIHHAMAYGVPVITDNDPLTQPSESELLVDGFNGLTYNAGNMQDFAAKINRLLDDDTLRRYMSANARETVETKHTLEQKVANFNRAFQRLLELRERR